MLSRISFESEYGVTQGSDLSLRWYTCVNRPKDVQALGVLISSIHQDAESNSATAYLAVMDIISHANSKFLINSLHRGGIIALRNLVLHTTPSGCVCKGLLPGLAILNKLVKTSLQVRCCLLDYWGIILRPVKLIFSRMDKSGVDLTLHRKCNSFDITEALNIQFSQCLPHDSRVSIQESKTWLSLSDFLRNIEFIFVSAPDATKESVDRICKLNRDIDQQHVTLSGVKSNAVKIDKCTPQGPRIVLPEYHKKPKFYRRSARGAVHPDVAMNADWYLQAVRLDQNELYQNIEHMNQRQSAFETSAAQIEDDEPVVSEAEQEVIVDKQTHNVFLTDDYIVEMPQSTREPSDTNAVADPIASHLHKDPRQSKRFQKIVKPLMNSLLLPESHEEALKIIFAGRETLPNPTEELRYRISRSSSLFRK